MTDVRCRVCCCCGIPRRCWTHHAGADAADAAAFLSREGGDRTRGGDDNRGGIGGGGIGAFLSGAIRAIAHGCSHEQDSLELPCAAAAAGRRGVHRRTRNLPSSDKDPEDAAAVAVLRTVPDRCHFFLPAAKSFSQG